VTARSRRPGIGVVVALVLAVHGIVLAADVPRAKGGPVRIGYLASLSEAGGGGLRDAFRAGLRDLGYVEGDNVLVEHRWANGDYTRLPVVARELVQLDLDLIVSAGGPSTARALKAATSTIPIVFVTGSAVAAGIVPGLARPGGNLTGLELVAEELDDKRLEVLTTLRPHARRIVVLWNPGTPEGQLQRRQLERAAEALGVTLRFVGARDPSDLATALTVVGRERADAMLVAPIRCW
jgi:putative ABC transport system substrate-binding protein